MHSFASSDEVLCEILWRGRRTAAEFQVLLFVAVIELLIFRCHHSCTVCSRLQVSNNRLCSNKLGQAESRPPIPISTVEQFEEHTFLHTSV